MYITNKTFIQVNKIKLSTVGKGNEMGDQIFNEIPHGKTRAITVTNSFSFNTCSLVGISNSISESGLSAESERFCSARCRRAV
jgi:hypothetical protein